MRKLFCMAVALTAVSLVGSIFCSSAQAQWGTLKGQVLLDGDIPQLKALDTGGKDPDVCGAQPIPDEKLVVDATSKGIANVIVYLPKKPAKIHPDLVKSKEKEVKFDQKGCKFIPHVTLVRTDQQVRVLSDDATNHNTRANPLKNDALNFTVPANDRVGILVKPLTIAEKLPTTVKCDIHTWMTAYWLILDHPYAAVTDKDGNFEIPNLPVGSHEFTIWHEGAGYLNRNYAVKIAEGANDQKPLKFTADKVLTSK